ncbi:MAG: DNA integrity scanning protein DisA nucleotide-binding domain protein [Planctomycetota bacterium]
MSNDHAYPADASKQGQHVLKYFMWGYQSHACVSMSVAAERVFIALAPGLRPTVHLIGFLDEDRQDGHPICVEPEDGGYSPDQFAGVKSLAETLQAAGNGTLYLHPSQAVADRFAERDRRSYVRKALCSILEQMGAQSSRIAFCGRPEKVEGFLVTPVLQLNRAVYESLPRLPLDHQIGDRSTFCPSLADALVRFFLCECLQFLRQPQPGAEFGGICPDEWEALRQAATSFMYAVSSAGDTFEGLHGLYAACNGVSSLRYEGQEGVGRLVIAKRRHPDVFTAVELQSSVGLRNYRAVRKLLELSDSSQALLSDSARVYGLGRILSSYNASLQNLFEVEFMGHYQWRVLHAGRTLMEVAYDRPQLPKPRLARERFESVVQRLFPGVGRIDLDNLWNLVGAAVEQKHGTMLVISDSAQSEAERLASQSTLVSPMTLTPEIMRLVSKIDGAVVIDPHGLCVAIGVILDGMASRNGNSGRGARYNSAIRYVETMSPKKTLAIVVSEDGSVDLVPDLKPQIDRREITSRLDELFGVAAAEQLNMKHFYEIMNWFSAHRFYLSPEVCKQLNGAKKAVYARHHDASGSMVIIEPDFEPDPQMSDEYFLPDKAT